MLKGGTKMPSITPKHDKFVAEVYTNTQSNLIEITEDKLENTIIKFLTKYMKANSWLTPFSIVVSILFTLLTSEVNKNLFNVSKEIWNAIFYLSLAASLVWLAITIFNHFRFRKDSKIESLICKIKNVSN